MKCLWCPQEWQLSVCQRKCNKYFCEQTMSEKTPSYNGIKVWEDETAFVVTVMSLAQYSRWGRNYCRTVFSWGNAVFVSPRDTAYLHSRLAPYKAWRCSGQIKVVMRPSAIINIPPSLHQHRSYTWQNMFQLWKGKACGTSLSSCNTHSYCPP
jgi:hypothetical protein